MNRKPSKTYYLRGLKLRGWRQNPIPTDCLVNQKVYIFYKTCSFLRWYTTQKISFSYRTFSLSNISPVRTLDVLAFSIKWYFYDICWWIYNIQTKKSIRQLISRENGDQNDVFKTLHVYIPHLFEIIKKQLKSCDCWTKINTRFNRWWSPWGQDPGVLPHCG